MTGLRPGDVVTDRASLRNLVMAALGSADCNCEPGDGTCKDWSDRLHRHRALADALTMRIGNALRMPIPGPQIPAPAGDAAAELEALASEIAVEAGRSGDGMIANFGGWMATRMRARAAELHAAAPAEEWEPVTADQVRVGDHIEVTKTWDGGQFVASGIVTAVCRTLVFFGPRHSFEVAEADGRLFTSVAIRRRPRQPMPEPDAPAIYRHAKHLVYRPARAHGPDCWLVVDGPHDAPGRWHTWAGVLALDPATDPVVVTLGTSGDVSPLGEPARPGHCQVLIGDGYCHTHATWDVDFLCPDGTMRTERMCTRHASHARMVGGCVCALHNGEHITPVARMTLRGKS